MKKPSLLLLIPLIMRFCASNDQGSTISPVKQNGEIGIRLLALELNNAYELIKSSNSTAKTDYIEMPASLITSDILKKDSNITNIYDVAPETYGNTSTYVTSTWLKNLIGY